MFKNSFQSGFVTILYAGGTRPLAIWDQTVKNGHIRRVTDEEVQTLAVEVMGTNVATTYISCPPDKKQTLGIRLPFFVMLVKNMNKYFTFEIQILDDKNMSRRFRVSNYQSTTRVRPFSTALPIGLTPGWNQIQFNLADFTRRAYGSTYLETLRVHIHANIRIRRIFFSDRLYAEDELPLEFRLYIPMEKQKTTKQAKGTKDKGKKEDEKVSEREQEIRDHIKKSLEKLPPDASPSGAPPSPIETARDEDSVADVEFVVAPAEKPTPDYIISTEEPMESEATDGEEELNVEIILPSEDGEMQEETDIDEQADIAEQNEIETGQEATEQSDADSPEPEEEIVFTDPVSEPEESVAASDAELSEALTDVGLDSEPEAEIEVEE
ncbi:Basal body up regulated gene 22 [Carabus blaptoides fortunei]